MANKISSGSAWNAYKRNEQNKPKKFVYDVPKPTFDYDDTDVRKYYDQLLNRKDFTFDINNNALYNQVKDNYTKQGQLAMMDTVGQAASMTGGYGNSWAVSAGQQAYQQSLDKINEAVPEIYQLALEQYQMEGQNLLDKYGLAAGERDNAYGIYRDERADYYTERDFAYGQHRDDVVDYQADRDYLYGVYADSRDYEYQQGRDKVHDQQWSKEQDLREREHQHNVDMDNKQYNLQVKEFAEQIRQYEKNYALSEKEFNEMCKQWAAEYNLDVDRFKEDVRQYNTSLEEEQRQFNESLSYEKERDQVDDNQWAHEFAEEQRQFDASLAEDQRQFNISNDKDEDGGLSQETMMGWLAEYGLLNESNIDEALTDWDGFFKNLGGKLSGASGNESTKESAINEIDAVEATKDASKLTGQAKNLYNALASPKAHYENGGAITEGWANSVIDAYYRGDISAADAKYLLNLFVESGGQF